MAKRKLLVATDDLMLLDSLEEQLGAHFDLSTAPGGMEALYRLEAQPFELVVIEAPTPGFPRLEVLWAIQQITPGALVVLILGMAEGGLAVQALKRGCFSVVFRPVDPEGLLVRLQQAVGVLNHQGSSQTPPREAPRDFLQRAFTGGAGHSLETLARDIAAELEPPLGAAQASTAPLRKYLELAPPAVREPAQQHLLAIETHLAMARRLVGHWAHLGEGETGRPVLFNVREVAGQVVNMFQAPFQTDGITFSLKIPGDLKGRLDQNHFQQVLINLITNAGDSLRGARRCKGKAEKKIRLTGFAKAGLAVVDVSDNGCGVPPSLAKTVFKPFVTSKGPGGGMGLYISRVLLESRHGRIELLKTGPGGTTFRLEFPA